MNLSLLGASCICSCSVCCQVTLGVIWAFKKGGGRKNFRLIEVSFRLMFSPFIFLIMERKTNELFFLFKYPCHPSDWSFMLTENFHNFNCCFFQRPNQVVAIKAIAKKNLAKSQNLLGKEIKILKVRRKKQSYYHPLHSPTTVCCQLIFSSFNQGKLQGLFFCNEIWQKCFGFWPEKL